MRLGFIGLGQMGHPMARLLLEAGHELAVPGAARVLEAMARVALRAPTSGT